MTKMPMLIDIFQAAERIKPIVRHTPVFEAIEIAHRCSAMAVHYKMECLQRTGSFKVRGATNKYSAFLTQKKTRRNHLSTGNHGKAVAYVAARLGLRAVVCLSEKVPSYRADLIRNLGAEVIVKGKSQDEAEEHYYQIIEEQGLTPVVPFDDPLIISGQGTIGKEVLEQLPQTDMLLIPLSGGGLLSGIALAAKQINPAIHIVGFSRRSPAMLEA